MEMRLAQPFEFRTHPPRIRDELRDIYPLTCVWHGRQPGDTPQQHLDRAASVALENLKIADSDLQNALVQAANIAFSLSPQRL